MPEALARIRNDSVLVAPRRRTATAKPPSRAAWLLRVAAFLPRQPGPYAAAALTAVVIGIGANALVMQREHRPVTVFGSATPVAAPAPVVATAPVRFAAPSSPAASAPAPTPAVLPAAEPGPSGESPAAPNRLPPPRPSGLRANAEAPASSRAGDAIGDWLRGGPSAAPAPHESSRLTLAAQNALVKLGYVLKPTGVAGPDTLSALKDFEKSHGLPVSTEISAKLVKTLTGALGAQASR